LTTALKKKDFQVEMYLILKCVYYTTMLF